jgi:hypothetical protein
MLLAGGALVSTRRTPAPDGRVDIAPPPRATAPAAKAVPARAPDTVTVRERLPASDLAGAAAFAIELVAANTSTNANSLLASDLRAAALPAATISVVAVRRGTQGAARWHKVMFGAWRESAGADSALTALRRSGVVGRSEGAVVRAPYAVLLADSVTKERATAVMDAWRAKGVVPYALVQADGRARVYAGAFETVAQGMAMSALVRAVGGAPIMAYRTGRPD